MAPTNRQRTKKNTEKVSRQYTNHWWKLKVEDRKKHNQLMRIQLLSPFLFCKVYLDEKWIESAKTSGLISQRRMSVIDELSTEELINTELIEISITTLQDVIISQYKTKSSSQFLEGIFDSITDAHKLNDFFNTQLTYITTKHWFTLVKCQIEIADGRNFSLDSAIYLAGWQMCHYIKSIYQGEKHLEMYEADSTMNGDLEKIKEQGNQHFKENHYSKAINCYTKILYNTPYVHIIYGNRAACYLKKHEFQSALADGRRASTLNPTWDKGQYRYAEALFELGHSKAALEVVHRALLVCPDKTNLEKFQTQIKAALEEEEKEKHNLSDSNNLSDSKQISDFSSDDDDNDDYYNDSSNDSEQSDDHNFQDIPDLITDNDTDCEDRSSLSDEEEVPKKKKKTKKVENKQGLISNLLGEANAAGRRKKERDQAIKEQESKDKIARKNSQSKKKEKQQKEEEEEKLALENQMEKAKTDLLYYSNQGSIALLENNLQRSIHEYQRAIVIHAAHQKLILEEDAVLLNYAHATACFKAATLKDLNRALGCFKHINKTYQHFNFSLSYYGIGRVLRGLFRFNDAIDVLNVALEVEKKRHAFLNVCWPGCDTIIEESKPGQLEVAVLLLLEVCRNPPRPSGECRQYKCAFKSTAIYLDDPEMEGYMRLCCNENCLIDFHFICWKKFKKEIGFTEKEYLKSKPLCMTPDCEGMTVKITMHYTDDQAKCVEWEEEKVKKPAVVEKQKVDKSKRMKPSSELRKEKKIKKLAERKLRKLEKENNNIAKIERVKSPEVKTKDKENIIEENIDPIDHGYKMVVLNNKINDPMFQQSKPKKKVKPKKEGKQKVLLDIQFPKKPNVLSHLEARDYNPYDRYHHTPYTPYTHHHHAPTNSTTSALHSGTDTPSYADAFDIYNNIVKDPVVTATYIFSLVEALLEGKGWLDVLNSRELHALMDGLDENSTLLIDVIGGLRAMLLKCDKFSFDDRNCNVVYLTAEEDAFQIWKERLLEKHKTELPQCEEPLFTDIFSARARNNSGPLNPYASEFSPLINDYFESLAKFNRLSSLENDIVLDEKPAITAIITEKEEKPVVGLPVLLPVSNVKEEKENSEKNGLTDEEYQLLLQQDPSKMKHIVESSAKKESPELFEMLLVRDAKRNGKQTFVEPMSLMTDEDVNKMVNKNQKSQQDKKISKTEENKPVSNHDIYRPGRDKVIVEEESVVVASVQTCTSCFQFYAEGVCPCIQNRKIVVVKHQKKQIADENKLNCEIKPAAFVPAAFMGWDKLQKETVKNESKDVVDHPMVEPPMCVVEVGIQTSLPSEEVEALTRKNKILMETNKALITERRVNQQRIDETADAMHKLKVKMTTSQDKANEERQEFHNTLKQLKSDVEKQQKSYQAESKKFASEKKDLQNKITSLKKQIENNEELDRMKKEGKEQEKTVLDLEKRLEKARREREEDRTEYEELVQRLTQTNNEVIKRAQTVEMAFLRVNEDNVVAKYQKQGNLVRNIKQQMQFWPKMPEVIQVCLTWDAYEKKLQEHFKKMEAEFKCLAEELQSGKSLKELPGSKYADVPPMPSIPQNMFQFDPNQQQDPRLPVPPSNVSPPPVLSGSPPMEVSPPVVPPVSAKQPPATVMAVTDNSILAATHNVPSNNPGKPTTHNQAGHTKPSNATTNPTTKPTPFLDAPVKPVRKVLPPPNSNAYCTTCQIQLTSATQLLQHQQGQAHKIKEGKVGATAKNALPATKLKKLVYKQNDEDDNEIEDSRSYSCAASKEADDSDTSSVRSNEEPVKHGKMFDKTVMKLGTLFPNLSREELRKHLSDYRASQKGSLSGVKMETVVGNVSKIIRDKIKPTALEPAQRVSPPKNTTEGFSPVKTNSKKPLPNNGASNNFVQKQAAVPSPVKRTRANYIPQPTSSHMTWANASAISKKTNSNATFGNDESCVICFAEMTRTVAVTLQCGHIFHKNCIGSWLKEQRTCPICREHALLPDDFPALG